MGNTTNQENFDNSSEEVKKIEEIDTHIQNLKKSDAAKLLVKKAKFLVKESEHQMRTCKIIFDRDLEGFESAKQKLKDKGLDASEALLLKLGYKAETKHEIYDDINILDPKNKFDPFPIKEVDNGKLPGMLLSFLTALIVFLGLIYLSSMQMGISRNLLDIPFGELMNPVLNWYATLLGMDDSPLFGGVFVLGILGVCAWGTYRIYMNFKEKNDLHMAKRQLIEAEAYCVEKGTCKDQMQRVDAYINRAISTLKLYQVVLYEQEGKLGRIFHIERDKIASSNFDPKSLKTMQDTQELVDYIKDFMSTPIAEEGNLSAKSGLFLLRAQKKIEKMIEKIYKN